MIEGFEETLTCSYNRDSMNPLVIGEGYRKEASIPTSSTTSLCPTRCPRASSG